MKFATCAVLATVLGFVTIAYSADSLSLFDAKYSFNSECDTFPIIRAADNATVSPYKLRLVTLNVSCGFASDIVPPLTTTWNSSLITLYGSVRNGSDAAPRLAANSMAIELILRYFEFSAIVVKDEVFIYDPYVTAVAHMQPIKSARESNNRMASGSPIFSALQRVRATCFYVFVSAADRPFGASNDTTQYSVESCMVPDFRSSCALRAAVPKAVQNGSEDEALLIVRHVVTFAEGDKQAECVRAAPDSAAGRELFDALSGAPGRQSGAVYMGEAKTVRFRRLSTLNTAKLKNNEQVTLVAPEKVRLRNLFPVQLVARNVTDFQLTIRTKRGLNYVALNRRANANNQHWQFVVEAESDMARSNADDSTFRISATRSTSSQKGRKNKGKTGPDARQTSDWRVLCELLFEVDTQSTRGGVRLSYTVISMRTNMVTLNIDVSGLGSEDPLELVPVFKRDSLLNTAVLNGVRQLFPLRIFGLVESMTSPSVTVRDLTANSAYQLECASEDQQVVEVANSCAFLYFQGTETRARMRSRITIVLRKVTQSGDAAGELHADLFVNVYLPKAPEIQLSSYLLGRLANWYTVSSNRRGAPSLSDQGTFSSSDCRGRFEAFMQTQVATVQLFAQFYSVANLSQTDSPKRNRQRQKATVARPADDAAELQTSPTYREVEVTWPEGNSQLLITHLFDPTRIRAFASTAALIRPVRDGNVIRLVLQSGRAEETLTVKLMSSDNRRVLASQTAHTRGALGSDDPVSITEFSANLLQLGASTMPTVSFGMLPSADERDSLSRASRLLEPLEFAVDYDPLRIVRLNDLPTAELSFYLDLRVRFSDLNSASIYDFDAESYTLSLSLTDQFVGSAQLRLVRQQRSASLLMYYYLLDFDSSAAIEAAALKQRKTTQLERVTLSLGELQLRRNITRDSVHAAGLQRTLVECVNGLGNATLATTELRMLVELSSTEVTTGNSIKEVEETEESPETNSYDDYPDRPLNNTTDEDDVLDRYEAVLNGTRNVTATDSANRLLVSSASAPSVTVRVNTSLSHPLHALDVEPPRRSEHTAPAEGVANTLSSPLAIALFCLLSVVALSLLGLLVFCAARRHVGRFSKSPASRSRPAGEPEADEANAEWMWIAGGTKSGRSKRDRDRDRDRERDASKRESAASLLHRSSSDAIGCALPCSSDVLPASFCSRDGQTPVSITFSASPPSSTLRRAAATYSPLAIDDSNGPMGGSCSLPRRTRLGTSSFATAACSRSPNGTLDFAAHSATAPRVTVNPLNGTAFAWSPASGTQPLMQPAPVPYSQVGPQNGMMQVGIGANQQVLFTPSGQQLILVGNQPVLVPNGANQQLMSAYAQWPNTPFANQMLPAYPQMAANSIITFGDPQSAVSVSSTGSANGTLNSANRLSRIAERSDEEDDYGHKGKKQKFPDLFNTMQQQMPSSSVAMASATLTRHSAKQRRGARSRSKERPEGAPLLSSFPVTSPKPENTQVNDYYPDIGPPQMYAVSNGDTSYMLPTSVYATLTRKPVCRVQPAQKDNLPPFAEMNALSNPNGVLLANYFGGMKESFT